MFEVKDGSRTLQFEGELLASSSSRRGDSIRWIEFKLYKTEQGSYILSRIGASLIYHGATCRVVKKYGLKEADVSKLEEQSLACEDCNPDESAQLVFPESYRYWAQVSDQSKAVLEALYKYDDSGARYLTYVARTLLEKASDVDLGVKSIYRIELVP
jgi:hypothetical protein